MIRPCVPVLMTVLAAFGGPRHASAQLGPLIDWIHEMSGPKFVQWGATFSLGYQPGLELDTVPFATLRRQVERLRDAGAAAEREQRITELTNSVNALIQAVEPYTGSTRYRAVLVDALTAEARRLSDDVAVLATGNVPITDDGLDQLIVRTARLIPAADRFGSIDALDRGNGMRGRLAISGGTKARSDKEKYPDSAAVNVITVSPTAEYLFSRPLAFETGIGIHYFFGDIEPFWSVSMPVLLVVRPLAANRSRFLRSFRINFGGNIFAPLGSDAFEPLGTVPGTSFEWVWTGSVSLDFPIGRWGSS